MAGDWIKVECITPDKPEVLAIAGLLGIDPDAVLGKLVRLWVWANQVSRDGCAVSATDATIDMLVRLPGFAEAMRKTGWLHGENGHVSFPNFARHNGNSAKKRALAANRMRCARSATTAQPEKRREEKSKEPPLPPKEEKSKKQPAPPPEVPESLNTPEFRDAWADFQIHRSEIKCPLTPQSAKATLAKCSSWGSVVAVEAIRTAIACGWRGVFEPRNSRASPEVVRSSGVPSEEETRAETERLKRERFGHRGTG